MFKVYTETKEQEKDVYFKLVQEAKEVRLIVCDATGEREWGGTVLTITSSGKLLLHKGVHKHLGLKLDSCSRAVVDFEY